MKILKWISFIPLAIIGTLITSYVLRFIQNEIFIDIYYIKLIFIELICVAVFIYISTKIAPLINIYVIIIICFFILLPNIIGGFIYSEEYNYLFSISSFKFSLRLLIDIVCITWYTYQLKSKNEYF